jgi:hypothetical protein
MARAGVVRRDRQSAAGDQPPLIRQATPVICLVCVAGVASLFSQAASSRDDGIVRRFPYPFSHMVTIASDVDMQAPWHGAAIHRVINQEIGLPLSDSLWVQGDSKDASSLFLAGTELNARPSGVGLHTTFGLLLREWHRGNVDTLHSWQDDSVPPLQQQLRIPLRLASSTVSIPVAPTPEVLTSLYYRHLRLYFSAPPPDDLWLRLHADEGRSVMVSVGQVRAGRAVTADQAKPPHIVEIMMGVPPDEGLLVGRQQFDLARLQKVELHALSCAKGCPVSVTRLDRDSFSRQSVALQLPVLAAFNIRPAVVTSHGGFSYAQNFDAENYSATIPRAPGSAYESELVPHVLRNQGQDPRSHAYHADLLREFGVSTVWSFSRSSKHSWNEPVPAMTPRIPGFHPLVRTTVDYKATTLEEFQRELPAMEPGLKGVPLDDIFCAKVCWGDQGAVVGLLVALSIARIDSGWNTDHIWYTHLASGDLDFQRSPDTPLRPSTVAWLQRLSNLMFNFDGSVLPRRRVWVAPTGTIARYRIAHSQIGPHLTVDRHTSSVTINAWQDPITGKMLPDLAAGMRDLHGITIYVPDAAAASVAVAGRPTTSFTRNAPDESGRASITLVDDSTPTTMLDEVPLAAGGPVHVSRGTWREPNEPRAGSARGRRYGTLAAWGGDAVVRWKPGQLALWNTSHLEISTRRAVPDGQTATGRLFFEVEMADGGVIAATEGAAPAEAAGKSVWNLGPDSPGLQWRTSVLPVTELRWSPRRGGQRPSLPLGVVREVRFGLRGAAPGERLDIDSFRMLRPNSNNAAPDGRKFIGGQVVMGDRAVPRIVVEAARPDGSRLTTVTDRNGYYFFVRQPAYEIFRVAALVTGRRCAPLAGSILHLTRDEPELEIDLGRCR